MKRKTASKETAISRALSGLRPGGRKALICYVCAGDPDLMTTGRLVRVMAEAGADIIELGVPFSDPLADGPVIQRASNRAIGAGATISRVLGLVRDIRRDVEVPLVLMTYANPIFAYGVSRFVQEAGTYGVDGLIIPDLPVEEWPVLDDHVQASSMEIIPMLAPNSPDARLRLAVDRATSFVYCVSVLGTSGTRGHLDTARSLVARVRHFSDIPLVLGFGVGEPSGARRYAQVADGVVVGSAIVRQVERYGRDSVRPVARFVSQLRAAVDEASSSHV
ncbi:MAG: tryptophan synthase subunit alpha [Bacillota bacterium]